MIYNKKIHIASECIRDWDELNLTWWFYFKLRSIFAAAPASSKKQLFASKVDNSEPKIIILLLLPRFSPKPYYALHCKQRSFIQNYLFWLPGFYIQTDLSCNNNKLVPITMRVGEVPQIKKVWITLIYMRMRKIE